MTNNNQVKTTTREKMLFSTSRGLLISLTALFVHYLLIFLYSTIEIVIGVDIPFFETFPNLASVIIGLIFSAIFLVPMNFLIGFALELVMSAFFQYSREIRQKSSILTIISIVGILSLISIILNVSFTLLFGELEQILNISRLIETILEEIILYSIIKGMIVGITWWKVTIKYAILTPRGIEVSIW